MPISTRHWLVPVFLLPCISALYAQDVIGDRPAPLPHRRPLAPGERAHWEALALYGQGLVYEHQNELVQAMRAFEKAAHLDGQAVLPHKALIPLYLAAERMDDALRACRKTLELDPDDFEIGYLCSCQLKERGLVKEAIPVLARAVASPALQDHRDMLVQLNFELGMLYEEAKDPDRAEVAYRHAARVLTDVLAKLEKGGSVPTAASSHRDEIEAKTMETYERIVHVCLQGQHYDRAVAALEEAQAKHVVRSARLHYQLAQAFLGKNEPARALRHLDDYLRTQPADVDAYELRITLLKKLGRQDDIVPSLKFYADHDAHNVALHLLLAREYARAGKENDAERVYKSLANDAPAPDVYRGLFQLYRHGRLDEILALLDRTMADAHGKDNGFGDPGAALKVRAMLSVLHDDTDLAKELLPAALRSQRDLQPDTQRFLAVLAARSHQLDAAEKYYRQCLHSQLAAESEAEIYAGLIRVLWQAHKRQEVVAVCRQGLKQARATSSLLFHRNLALALALLGQADEALYEADEAVKLADSDTRLALRLTRVDVLRISERFKEAVAECEAMLREANLPADRHDIRYALSNVYSSAHNQARAEEQLRLVLAADAHDATACNDLGYIMADQGKNLPEAEDLIRKAIALDHEQRQMGKAATEEDQDHAAFIDSLGWVLFRRGQLEAAQHELEIAVGLPEGADDPVVWGHLGDVYFRKNDTAHARIAWQKAVKLYEAETRRRPDLQYKELTHKLQLLESQSRP